MNAFRTGAAGRGRRHGRHAAALVLAIWSTGALAQVVSVPDAHLNHAEGTVAHAPPGEREWQDIAPPRMLARGDRLWTDRGSRAEVQAGGHALRLEGQTHLTLENASDTATQISLTQGSVVATVTRVNPGDSFEVGTPNLALRARQPGDLRIDVDAKAGTTRVQVLSGSVAVFGEQGEVLELRNGQRATFSKRSLARVKQPLFAAIDDFDRWAGARRRGEPTVRMPAVATAPAAPVAAPAYNGRVIIIAGPASALPGGKPPPAATPPATTLPGAPQPTAKAQVMTAAPASAAMLRVARPEAGTATMAEPDARQEERQRAAQQQEEQGQAAARRAEAKRQIAAARRLDSRRAQAQREARQVQARRKEAASQRAHEQRQAAAARAQQQERRAQEARRIEDHRRAVLANKRTEKAQASRAQEQRRTQARRVEDERLAQEQRGRAQKEAAARKLEDARLAQARSRQLARLQEQAAREEQAARKAQAGREQQLRLAQEEWREDQARREEQARREAADRRLPARAEQSRHDRQRREQEVWLRQQHFHQPVRPAPMGVPARRVS